MDVSIRLRPGWITTGDFGSGDFQVNTPRSLLVATRNDGKLEELRQLLGDVPLDLHGLADFPCVVAVSETGDSFIENASLKAAGYAKQTGLLTLADDSGLEVHA